MENAGNAVAFSSNCQSRRQSDRSHFDSALFVVRFCLANRMIASGAEPTSGNDSKIPYAIALPLKGRAERLAFHRARGARSAGTQPAHLAPCAYSTGQPLLVRANGGATFPFRLRKAARPGSRYFACVPHAMDFAACCMSQEASLLPTRSRSCELSPGHALGPSARVAGICPPAT